MIFRQSIWLMAASQVRLGREMQMATVLLTQEGCTGLYSLPAAVSGYDGCGDVAALRPGDVILDLRDAGLFQDK